MPKNLRRRLVPDKSSPYRTRLSRQSRNPGTRITASHTRVLQLSDMVEMAAVENMASLPRTTVLPNGLDVGSSGGWIQYGGITRGQRLGVEAVVTRGMLRKGSSASYNFRFLTRKAGLIIVRGHLLARVLGGSGANPRNLIPLYHSRNNLPMFADIERRIMHFVRNGNVAHVIVRPQYTAPYPNAMSVFPSAVSVTAWDELRGTNVLPRRTVTFHTGFYDR
jgi:hypothetical protein